MPRRVSERAPKKSALVRRTEPPRTALVLSGGGARGAYQAGVVAGILEVLGTRRTERAPFSLFVGTSVGAINASYCAAHAHRGDLRVRDLEGLWTSLDLNRHLRVDPLALLRRRGVVAARRDGEAHPARSLFDPRPIEQILDVPGAWQRLHQNVRGGVIDGLLIAALHVQTGRTRLFAELAADVSFRLWPKERNVDVLACEIGLEHVLASSAVPLMFPPRRIDNAHFCDGGLRFNTPISPAIRAGASRLVVVSLRDVPGVDIDGGPAVRPEEVPHPVFLGGKVLDALLLDPVENDLQILARINHILEILQEDVPVETRRRMAAALRASRGSSYRPIDTLVFSPSVSLGHIASKALERLKKARRGHPMVRLLAWELAKRESSREADLASFLLFDRVYTEEILELGRSDARARADEIRRFFAGEAEHGRPGGDSRGGFSLRTTKRA